MVRETSKHSDGESFEEAIARYQLQLQSELKKTSSLPTAMFDASDEMIETQLCQATESILRCLLEFQRPDDADPEHEAMTLENVDPREVLELLAATATAPAEDEPAPDLDAGRTSEFTAVLADICIRSRGPAGRRAGQQLCDLLPGDDQDAGLLLEQLNRHLNPDAGDLELTADQVRTCAKAIATMIERSTATPDHTEARP